MNSVMIHHPNGAIYDMDWDLFQKVLNYVIDDIGPIPRLTYQDCVNLRKHLISTEPK